MMHEVKTSYIQLEDLLALKAVNNNWHLLTLKQDRHVVFLVQSTYNILRYAVKLDVLRMSVTFQHLT